MAILKKPLLLCSPQTKINCQESFFDYFLVVYFSGDLFFTMKPTTYCVITTEFQRTTRKAEKYLRIFYLFSRKSYPPSKRSFSFVKNIVELTLPSCIENKPSINRKYKKVVKMMIKTLILLWKTIEGNRKLRGRVRVRQYQMNTLKRN